MEWKGRKGSANVEDRRGGRKGRVAIAGGGIAGIILILLFTFLGGDPGELLNDSQIGGAGDTGPYEETAEEKEMAEFVSVVLADTEAIWSELFEEQGMVY
jgi:predicted metalloprotease